MNAAQIALAILGIGALIAWHELGHFVVARASGMRVLKYSLGFGPKLFSVVRNDIEYRISAIPLGGYVHIFGMTPLEQGAREDPRSFLNAPRWARIATVLAGPAFNYLLAFLLFTTYFVSWPGGLLEVVDVSAGSPAAEAGLAAGDRIGAVDNKRIRGPDLAARDLALTVVRGEGAAARSFEVALTTSVGLTTSYREFDVGVVEAATRAGLACYTYSARTLDAIGKLVLGDKEIRDSASGPPGIVKELKEAVSRGLGDFLWLLAFLNISLGLLNLLPVPALDGIKVLVLVVEGAARREINPYAMAVVNLIGFALLMGLILLVSIKDVAKMVG